MKCREKNPKDWISLIYFDSLAQVQIAGTGLVHQIVFFRCGQWEFSDRGKHQNGTRTTGSKQRDRVKRSDKVCQNSMHVAWSTDETKHGWIKLNRPVDRIWWYKLEIRKIKSNRVTNKRNNKVNEWIFYICTSDERKPRLGLPTHSFSGRFMRAT